MAAVRGTARRAPRKPPRRSDQKMMEKMTVMGWRPTESPTILGAVTSELMFLDDDEDPENGEDVEPGVRSEPLVVGIVSAEVSKGDEDGGNHAEDVPDER